MEPKTVRDRKPELVVEKLALGEASPPKRGMPPRGQGARGGAAEDNAAILSRYPPHLMATRIAPRRPRARPRDSRWMGPRR